MKTAPDRVPFCLLPDSVRLIAEPAFLQKEQAHAHCAQHNADDNGVVVVSRQTVTNAVWHCDEQANAEQKYNTADELHP